ncbi:MAG: carboxypeptidase-like regulatory domain-containing protein [Candidatus Acidiferrales bacterium]
MRKILLPGTALSLLAFLALPMRAPAQRIPVGTLEGTVLNAHGSPVADASVTIQTSDGQHPHATYTDSRGHFQFVRFETGQYDLRAYAGGHFSEWDRRVMLRHSKKPTQVTLRLLPSER